MSPIREKSSEQGCTIIEQTYRCVYICCQYVSGDRFARLQEHFFTFPLIDLFIDLFEFALRVSGDKFGHLQEHFLIVHIQLW